MDKSRNDKLKLFCNAPTVWGSLVNLYPLDALIDQGLITIY